MRIRQQTRLFLPILLGLAVLSLLIWSAEQDRQHQVHFVLIQSLASVAFNLSSLSSDIALHPEEPRPRGQWQETYRHLDEVLAQLGIIEEARVLAKLRRERDVMGDLFLRLEQITETGPNAVIQERQRRLASQMAMHTQALSAEANELMRSHHRGQLALRSRIDYLALGLILALTLFLASVAGLGGIRLIQRLDRLQRETEHIGAGDLEHRINDAHADELGDFARAFDAMTARLRQVTASRDELERTQAELHRANAELRDYRDGLEALVAARTAELEQARNRAETANRAKSVFLANMSHELRTPLNAILGFAQLLAHDNRIPEDDLINLATIDRSGKHLLGLINDVLEISRIEAGQLSLAPSTFDLRDLISGQIEIMSARAHEKGLRLDAEIDPDLPHFVISDPGKLRQVLLNLLSNAVKFTAVGHVSLSVRRKAAATQDAPVVLAFEVRDSGHGIAREDLKRIFHPFYQTETGIRVGEGTGLGLTISREYVRLLGGNLEVASDLGKGASFRFEIPVEPAAQSPDALASSLGIVRGLLAEQPACRVLVAEDNADSRRLLTEILRRAGFQVLAVSDGEQAARAFQDWHPDFIWMDMRMPVMDGYQATRQIRGLPGGQVVKIVALTASAFQEDRGKIIAAGCDEVLSKPLEESRLFAIMEKLLGLRYRYDVPPATPSGSAEQYPERLPPGVSTQLREALRGAADQLDVEATQAAIDRIRPIDTHFADQLDALVSSYRYDRIVAMCETVQS
jgi:signal transduction histidine kinase/CheY-like chemotaxis protein